MAAPQRTKFLVLDANGNTINTITLDASVRENHVISNEITDHAVEKGANISDHTRPKPDRLTMDCIISNATVSQDNQNPFGMDVAVWEELHGYAGTGTMFSIVTTLRRYDDMMLETCSNLRDAQHGDCLSFAVEWKHITFVENQLTTVKKTNDNRGKAKVKTGSQTTSTSGAAASSRSIGKGIYNTLTGSSNPTLSGISGATGG